MPQVNERILFLFFGSCSDWMGRTNWGNFWFVSVLLSFLSIPSWWQQSVTRFFTSTFFFTMSTLLSVPYFASTTVTSTWKGPLPFPQLNFLKETQKLCVFLSSPFYRCLPQVSLLRQKEAKKVKKKGRERRVREEKEEEGGAIQARLF